MKYDILGHAATGDRDHCMSDPDMLGYFLTFATLGHGSGHAFVIFLDESKKLLRTIKLKRGNRSNLPAVIDSISLAIKSDKRIKYFLLAHNHKSRTHLPSPEDILTTDAILCGSRVTDACFLGHYVTSNGSYILLTENVIHNIKHSTIKKEPVLPHDQKTYCD